MDATLTMGEGAKYDGVFTVPYKKGTISGDGLKKQCDAWAKYGTIEQDCADAIKMVVDDPGSIAVGRCGTCLQCNNQVGGRCNPWLALHHTLAASQQRAGGSVCSACGGKPASAKAGCIAAGTNGTGAPAGDLVAHDAIFPAGMVGLKLQQGWLPALVKLRNTDHEPTTQDIPKGTVLAVGASNQKKTNSHSHS